MTAHPSSPTQRRSKLSPIPEELSEKHPSESRSAVDEALQTVRHQATPKRAAALDEAGLIDLHSGLTPDLSSLVLIDPRQPRQ